MSQWTPHGGYGSSYTPNPYNSYTPYPFYSRPPETPQQLEAKKLRKDANYVGGMMLALTVGMQFTFSAVVLVLALLGFLDFRMLDDNTLGLDNTTYLLIYGCVYALAMGLPTVLVSLIAGRRRFPLSPVNNVSGRVAFFSVLFAMGVCMLANVIASYMTTFFEQLGFPAPVYPDLLEPTGTSLLLNILCIAVLPALLEEMVFRGYVMQALRPYGDGFAVFVSALLFGLMHGNVEQIPFAFCVGLVLGWLLIRTNNIFLAVAVHFCNNALSVLLDYFSRSMSDEMANTFYLIVMAAVGALGGLSLMMLCLFDSRLFTKLPSRSLLTASERTGHLCRAPVFLISVVVFVLLTVLGMI